MGTDPAASPEKSAIDFPAAPAAPEGRADPDRSAEISPSEMAVDTGRIQVLLAEKRTSLAALRTGIAIFTLPISVTTVLITTSKYYNFTQNLHYLIPLLVICTVLVLAGTYLIGFALLRFRHQGQQIQKIKQKSPVWQELLD
jgi:uncharacterized membrane protein YidH (DUF202 family)